MIKSEETNNKAMNTSKTSVTVKKSFQKTQSPTKTASRPSKTNQNGYRLS